jgi:MinD-like ATPase involved in chromosome partitioning or flagellar assembly
MSNVLVTVVGPAKRRDLSLPSEAPVAELVPRLVELVGTTNVETGNGHGANWMLAPAAAEPLPPDTSLGASGILDGTVLYLSNGGQVVPSASTPFDRPDDGLTPSERTKALLPDKLSAWVRVTGWLHTLVAGNRERTAPEPDGPSREEGRLLPSPASITVTHAPSRRRQAKETWRALDYIEQLDERIVAPRLSRSVTIAVVSPKGGVGKTTTTVLLGTVLALLRRDRTVAVDTNPDYGSLGRSLAPSHDVFVDDLLERLDRPGLTLTSLDAQLARAAHGLMVLPAPTDPARMAKLDETAYSKVIGRLQEFVGAVVLDCGTGLQEPSSRAALAAADQVVLVTDAEPAAASLVAEAALLLERLGRPLTLVVNKLPQKKATLDIESLGRHVPNARALITIPSEPEAAGRLAAGQFDWRDAPATWQRSVRELAVAIVSDWPRLGLTISE